MSSEEKSTQSSTANPPAATRRGLRVAASPFNGIKLELAVILVAGVLLVMVHGRWWSGAWQPVVLGGYGIAAMVWVMVRARRVMRRAAVDEGFAGPSDRTRF